ncbi:MAG: hypothetical protein VKL97_02555 [Cyanobacteriota bacterium]|nr:hypothetical protein [Cyanobacteriota bacterium]
MADRPNLPAPYTSPWRQLKEALAAVLASLRLDLRGLWRRNNSSELPRPSWWPRDLAPLLWPLLLALALGLLLALAALFSNLSRTSSSDERALEMAPSQPVLQPQAAPKAAPKAPAAPHADQPSDPAAPAPVPPPPKPAKQAAPAIPEPARPPAPDPLLEALRQNDSRDWLETASVHPEQGLLELQLSPSFEGLDPRRRRKLAESWLERSLNLGFEQLELVDPGGRVVGYRARVGSGMILLDPERAS